MMEIFIRYYHLNHNILDYKKNNLISFIFDILNISINKIHK